MHVYVQVHVHLQVHAHVHVLIVIVIGDIVITIVVMRHSMRSRLCGER